MSFTSVAVVQLFVFLSHSKSQQSCRINHATSVEGLAQFSSFGFTQRRTFSVFLNCLVTSPITLRMRSHDLLTAVHSVRQSATRRYARDHVMCSLCSRVHVRVGENETCTRRPWRRARGRWPCHGCPRGGAGGKRGGQPPTPAPSFSGSDVRAVCWHRRQAASLAGGDRLPGSAGGVRLWSSCLQAKEDHIIQVRRHTFYTWT